MIRLVALAAFVLVTSAQEDLLQTLLLDIGGRHFDALPTDFMWGSATASYQVEGAVTADGRGESIWDWFSHIPGKVAHNDTGDVADDEYNRYEEDVELLRDMGAGYYRLSIAWPRIMPAGEGEVNAAGIAHYNALIDTLLANGIRPLVTLYHWDLPLALEQKYGGWLNAEVMVGKFEDYARVCFEAFGDRVQWWLTFNEPWSFIHHGYGVGLHPPGRCSDRSKCAEGDADREPYIAAHTVLLAHAAAMDLYRREFAEDQGGRVGITVNGDWAEPFDTADPLDVEASGRFHEFQLGWFADPAFFGDYPESMKKHVGDRLPSFTPEQSALFVANKPSFFGFNHYTSIYSAHYPEGDPTKLNGGGWDRDFASITGYVGKDGKLIGPVGESPWLHVAPWGFRKLLGWVYGRYQTPIVVTENGFSVKGESNLPLAEALLDTTRVQYYSEYIAAMNDAVRAGEADVLGYFAWSFMDNYEWQDGFGIRFGLTYVDYTNGLTRHPKASAMWFTRLLALYADRDRFSPFVHAVDGVYPSTAISVAAAAEPSEFGVAGAAAAAAGAAAGAGRSGLLLAVALAGTAAGAVAAGLAAARRRRRQLEGAAGAGGSYGAVPEGPSQL